MPGPVLGLENQGWIRCGPVLKRLTVFNTVLNAASRGNGSRVGFTDRLSARVSVKTSWKRQSSKSKHEKYV